MVLAQRVWQAVAGVVSLAVVAHFLSPVEQGYFYTLASLAALYMALDLGLSALLAQFSSREFVGLHWDSSGEIIGQSSGFIALVRYSLRWYGFSALLYLLILPAGIYFIDLAQGGLANNWKGPWSLLVIATATSLLCLPVLAINEGVGQIAETYTVRLIQGVMGSAAIWMTLAFGGGLYAVGMLPLVSSMVVACWLVARRRGFIVQVFRARVAGYHWGREIWPLQWRTGASWLAGYALVLMHVPLLFRTQGPIVAGQMGVTMTIANTVSLLALSWITARIPSMAREASLKNWLSLDLIFWRGFWVSCWMYVSGAACFMALRYGLDFTTYGDRLLSLSDTAPLIVAMGFYHVSGLFAAYLRAHLKEPFVWPSIVGALLTATLAMTVAPHWGATGIVWGLLAVNGLYFFPITVYLWVKLRRQWHFDQV